MIFYLLHLKNDEYLCLSVMGNGLAIDANGAKGIQYSVHLNLFSLRFVLVVQNINKRARNHLHYVDLGHV
jgi:hypothetical protein